jgi:hypothetical protein
MNQHRIASNARSWIAGPLFLMFAGFSVPAHAQMSSLQGTSIAALPDASASVSLKGPSGDADAQDRNAGGGETPRAITPAGVWTGFGTSVENAPDGQVRALISMGGNVYVAGDFTHVGSVDANHVARWDGATWSSLGTGTQNGTDDVVFALATNGTDLYAAGSFFNAGGASARRIAKWDGANWTPLGTGVGSGVVAGSFVSALAVLSGKLYAAGAFNQAGGVFPLKNMAVWDFTAETWGDVGGGCNNSVSSLAVFGGVLYVGGPFTLAGATTAKYIASWNGTGWNAVSGGMDGQVNAMAVVGSSLYAGGGFTHANGTATLVNHIARFNGVWNSLGTGAANGLSIGSGDTVRALAAIGGDLYVGGMFTTAGGSTANNIAHWDGTTWASLGVGVENGVNGTVSALVPFTDALYVGGIFTQAGTQTSSNLARWNSDVIFADGFEALP